MFTPAASRLALDAIVGVSPAATRWVQLHVGDPGDGTSARAQNATRKAVAFDSDGVSASSSSAKASLVRPVLVSSATARPPKPALVPSVRLSAMVAGSASATVGARLIVRPARAVRRTHASGSTSRLVAPHLAAAATGSVWTQIDEEAELMMLGLFA